jgi:hypothetical protein
MKKAYTCSSRNNSCSSKNENGELSCEAINGDALNAATLGNPEPHGPSDAPAVVSGLFLNQQKLKLRDEGI